MKKSFAGLPHIEAVRATGFVIALLLYSQSFGQGGLQLCNIFFEGPPAQLPGTVSVVESYTENGFLFTQGAPGEDLLIRNGGGIPLLPDNGTAYIQSDSPSVPIVCTSKHLFVLLSVDLAEYSAIVSNSAGVRLVGYAPDGTSNVLALITNGLLPPQMISNTIPATTNVISLAPNFQSFHPTSFWSPSLSRLEIYGQVSVDKLVLVVNIGVDGDGDGVPDVKDFCPDTAPGAAVDEHGCSIDQLAPCSGPLSGGTWKNHGQYISAVTGIANHLHAEHRITSKQRKEVVEAAFHSACGKKPWDRDRLGPAP